MSLRSFHLFFITISSLLSLFLVGWGIQDYRATGDSTGIVLAIVGAVGLFLLMKYFTWFRSKNFGKLAPGLGLIVAGLTQFSLTNSAQACSVCYTDPDSLMTKGTLTGVLVLFVIIVGVLSLIFSVGLSWVRRARALSTHF